MDQSVEEHFFKNHEVAGEVVTRTKFFELSKFGYQRPDDKPSFLTAKEITIPVYQEDQAVLVRAVEYKPPVCEEDEGKPVKTMIIIGGGSSDAGGNIALAARMEDALDLLPDPSFRVGRFILLSHPEGMPRSKPGEGKEDLAGQKTLEASARTLAQALEHPEFGFSSASKVLVGFSEGGTLAAEMAGLEPDKYESLVLADPAGMAEHPRMMKELKRSRAAARQKYQARGFSKQEASKLALQEVLTAWTAPHGSPTGVLGLARELMPWSITRQKNRVLGEAYGFENRSPAANTEVAKTDSTQEARKKITARVFFAPVTLAKVVNIITDRLTKYDSQNLVNTHPANLRVDVLKMLKDMFPQAAACHFIDYPEITHSSVMTDQEYWQGVMAKVNEAEQQKQAH